MIYTDFETWKRNANKYLDMVEKGFYGLVVESLLLGLVSFSKNIRIEIKAFVEREKVATVVISALFLLIGFGWVSTFVSGRYKYVTMQHKADSLSLELGNYTQSYYRDEYIIIHGDTLK